MGKIITFGNEARNKILEGMIELEKAVCSTLGPKGKCVLLDKGNRHPFTTKDGVTVANNISFSDKYKDIGASIIQEVAQKVNALAGDGTTTSTLITTELCKAGNELVSLKMDSSDIKKGFEKAASDLIEELEKQKKVIESEDDILHIATISANNDEDIGEVIKEAFVNIGDGGLVTVQPNFQRNGKTEVKYTNGIEYDKGFKTSALCNTNEETIVYENPRFFFYGEMLKNIQDISAVFSITKDPVVIVAPKFSDKFESDFLEFYEAGKINGTFITPDGTDIVAEDNLKDMSVLLGATIIGGKGNKQIDSFTMKDLGNADRLFVSARKTMITGGKGSDDEIEKRIVELKKEIEEGSTDAENVKSEYEIQHLNRRIAKLSGGIATIYFGAFSDIEAKEKKDRYDDAINAVQAAIKEGILAGGGAGLLHSVKNVLKNHKPLKNPVQESGYQEFMKVMEMPARTIISSTGKDAGYWIEKIKESENMSFGFNAKTETWSDDLYKEGVVDPAKVIITTLKYGTSIACTFLMSDCIITSDLNNVKVIPNDEVLDRERGAFNGGF